MCVCGGGGGGGGAGGGLKGCFNTVTEWDHLQQQTTHNSESIFLTTVSKLVNRYMLFQ